MHPNEIHIKNRAYNYFFNNLFKPKTTRKEKHFDG